MRSDPRGDNWAPIRPTEPDVKLYEGSLRALSLTPDGGFIAVGNAGASRGSRNLMIRNVAIDEVKKFPETNDRIEDESERQPDRIRREYDAIIEGLENDSLLLPWEARKHLALAKQMKQKWQSNFDERASLSESHGAILNALNESEPFRRVSRIATRIAVVVLLIYLVQIMVNLYRYNIRLAGFYQARADAIDLLAISNVSLGASLDVTVAKIAAALSPDNVDFGKTPMPPSQQVVEMLGDAAKSARSGVSA